VITCVLGVDPGPHTGVAWLTEGRAPLVFQCNPAAAVPLVEWLLDSNEGPAHVSLAGEGFVPGRGAGARQEGAMVTRALIEDLDAAHDGWHWRSAAAVKPWARLRLEKSGLLALTDGLGQHSRDAAMHAIFCAVHDRDWPDPLSKDGPAFWKAMRG
jgi:hypothetical protein